MLSKTEFEILLSKSESSTLDFKQQLYDFHRNSNEFAKFIKDVISFSNTIRTESSYIIFGIKETDLGTLDLIGLTDNIDDAILQEKIRSKVHPTPTFKYYSINYKDKVFGILEFPVTKYDLPLSPTEKMKGLEPGKFYFRNGTSNTEASGLEALKINKWLDSLPGFQNSSYNEKLSDFLIRLSNSSENLSTIIPELLAFAKLYNWTEVIDFCAIQIKGIKKADHSLSYREQKVAGSLYKAEFNSNPYVNVSQDILREEMNSNKDFYPVQVTFPQTLLELENFIQKFEKNSGVTMTIQEHNAKQLSESNTDAPFYIYCLEDDYKTVYNNIRQKAIDLLMEK